MNDERKESCSWVSVLNTIPNYYRVNSLSSHGKHLTCSIQYLFSLLTEILYTSLFRTLPNFNYFMHCKLQLKLSISNYDHWKGSKVFSFHVVKWKENVSWNCPSLPADPCCWQIISRIFCWVVWDGKDSIGCFGDYLSDKNVQRRLCHGSGG